MSNSCDSSTVSSLTDNDSELEQTVELFRILSSLSQSTSYVSFIDTLDDDEIIELTTTIYEMIDDYLKDNILLMCEPNFHSNMEKEERSESFKEFRSGKYRVCIATNVLARGIDIQQVSMVINFDLPKCDHTYLHRIGRSGRWGRKGTGINFITKRDIKKLRSLEEYYNTEIRELPETFVNKY